MLAKIDGDAGPSGLYLHIFNLMQVFLTARWAYFSLKIKVIGLNMCESGPEEVDLVVNISNLCPIGLVFLNFGLSSGNIIHLYRKVGPYGAIGLVI